MSVTFRKGTACLTFDVTMTSAGICASSLSGKSVSAPKCTVPLHGITTAPELNHIPRETRFRRVPRRTVRSAPTQRTAGQACGRGATSGSDWLLPRLRRRTRDRLAGSRCVCLARLSRFGVAGGQNRNVYWSFDDVRSNNASKRPSKFSTHPRLTTKNRSLPGFRIQRNRL